MSAVPCAGTRWLARSNASARPAVLVRGLAERKIVQIACGPQHALALDSDGCAVLYSLDPHVPSLTAIYAGQTCVRLGVQRVLPSRAGKPAGRARAQDDPSSKPCSAARTSPPANPGLMQFAGPNEITMGAHIVAGPSNSVVIDKQGMYYMAGKWKNTGDGEACPDAVKLR